MNAKLSDSQLNKLKRAVKNKQGTTLRMNARMFSANNLPHELLLTTRQTTKLRNAIENNMSTDIKLPTAQISKIIQSGGFLGSLLSKIAGPLMKVVVPFAKDILAPLGITAAASAIEAGTTTLIVSNEEINDTIKLFKPRRIQIFYSKESLKQLKMKQKNKKVALLVCY